MTLWGGRFSDPPSEAVWRFTVDDSDRRLLADDVAGSIAHVTMLGSVGLLTPDEADVLRGGLEQVAAEAAAGSFAWGPADEDVHTAVERRLGELCGPLAGKLHTGRSRNDQVSLDLRLYLRRAAVLRIEGLRRMVGVLAAKAEEVGDVVVASYTHLQQAQSIPLAHHLLAYAWMLLRDAERFVDAVGRIAVSPLGAGASAGSSLPLDPEVVARELDLPAVFENSLDAVASRDFVAEYTFCAAQAMAHLSRFAEELVLWSTAEFGWVEMADEHTTGSSALPHKKNPDVAELVRGRAGAVAGDVVTLLAIQKGLPLSYNRDLQEDKRAVFHADDTLAGALEAVAEMVAGTRFDPPPPTPAVAALDLAEALVGRGVPFRQAHEAVGRLVARVAADGRTLADVTAEELTAAHEFAADDVALLDASRSTEARATRGGGSMASVESQLRALRARLDQPEQGV